MNAHGLDIGQWVNTVVTKVTVDGFHDSLSPSDVIDSYGCAAGDILIFGRGSKRPSSISAPGMRPFSGVQVPYGQENGTVKRRQGLHRDVVC